MKIEETTTTKLMLSDLNKEPYFLDPVAVYLEDQGPSKGKITITCYGQSWTSYWGSMGERSIARFFVACDNHYLAKNLDSLDGSIPDTDKEKELINERLLKDGFDESTDWDLFNEIESIEDIRDWIMHGNPEHVETVYGEEPWFADVAMMPNPRYTYLCRIIDATRDGLKQYLSEKKDA